MASNEGTSKLHKYLMDILRWIIIILSVLLIVFISVDTFKGINFLENHRYMTFQFWVCVIFMNSVCRKTNGTICVPISSTSSCPSPISTSSTSSTSVSVAKHYSLCASSPLPVE